MVYTVDLSSKEKSQYWKSFFNASGVNRVFDAEFAMQNELYTLKKVEKIINVPRPIAFGKDFSCVVITEHLPEDLITT